MFTRATTLLLLISPLAFTQDFRANLSGIVTDPSGAAIDGAAVVAKATETGAESRALTNTEGRYQISFLTPGSYAVSVENQGFHRLHRGGTPPHATAKAAAPSLP